MISTEVSPPGSRPDRAMRLKEAVISAFNAPASEVAARLREFTEKDWRKAMFWLHASGLALYLLDRLAFLGMIELLPAFLVERLRQNLSDNRARTTALFEETVVISRLLGQAGVRFALLKGMTLSPHSVPATALRFQLDLDLLLAERDSDKALKALGSLGYKLHAVSGNTLELKAGTDESWSIDEVYKVRTLRSLELHLQPSDSRSSDRCALDRLVRAQWRRFRGVMLPALSPPDLFLSQALHLFKHICSEHTRASWVLEFWRHVLARHRDVSFWREVERLAALEPQSDIAIGAVTLLATQMFGAFAPKELSRWTMDRLSAGVRLWVKLYGQRVLLADFPGNKFYLLLRQQLQIDNGLSGDMLRRLFPMRLPPRITHGEAGEPLFARFRRCHMEARFLFFRLRFHVIEGLRFGIESLRWQRRLVDMAQ